MSVELNLAITLPAGPLVPVAAGAGLVLLLLVAFLIRRRRRKNRVSPWQSAADELGVEFVKNGSDHGSIVRGRVNQHVVTVAPTSGKGRGKKSKATLYNVKYEAPEAPKFILMKRVDDRTPVLDTGNPKFDAVVSVRAEKSELFADFLTPARRAAILRLLTYWPVAQITDREIHLKTTGIEDDHDKLVDTVCHLVAAAEAFDRPTPRPKVVEKADAEDATLAGQMRPSGVEGPTGPLGEGGVLTDVRLDEAAVLSDLFASDLDDAGIATRFANVYQGQSVNWTGEVLRVGAADGDRQRIAAFIGSADGRDPNSGRVVALTAVPIDPTLTEGDVVRFGGTLVNLEAGQRLFHIA